MGQPKPAEILHIWATGEQWEMGLWRRGSPFASPDLRHFWTISPDNLDVDLDRHVFVPWSQIDGILTIL